MSAFSEDSFDDIEPLAELPLAELPPVVSESSFVALSPLSA